MTYVVCHLFWTSYDFRLSVPRVLSGLDPAYSVLQTASSKAAVYIQMTEMSQFLGVAFFTGYEFVWNRF
jgi:hypothetical protein